MKRIPRIKMPVSPIGTASFPKLTKPDFKYKAIEGEFSVRLILTPEEVADYKQTYDEKLKELYKWQCEQEGKQKLKMSAYPRFVPDTDKDGNETGNTAVIFKMKHKIVGKDGEVKFEKRPVIFDRHGKPKVDPDYEVGYGARIQVVGVMVPYYTGAIGFGVTFEPEAVMVHEEGSSGFNVSDASSYGFTVDEEEKVNGGESLPDTAFGTPLEEEEPAHASDF
jgi:hypothetical protein